MAIRSAVVAVVECAAEAVVAVVAAMIDQSPVTHRGY
jgi:hypothetical protein